MVQLISEKNIKPLRILLAPDSFKGSLTSVQVIDILEKAAKLNFPDAKIIRIPVADGGEGTVDAIVEAAGGEYVTTVVSDPLGRKIPAKYGIIGTGSNHSVRTAVIEIAQASGLTLLKPEECNPLKTSTYGTGELIRHALENDIRNFVLGIGGSATNDGGTGAAQALGVRFITGDEEKGNCFRPDGEGLVKIKSLDLSRVDRRALDSRFTIICDVKNPMTGPKGATYIYGPQKGAKGEMLEKLESGMKNYENILQCITGKAIGKIPGTGAAGGFGATFAALFGAVLKPGIETILDLIDFDSLLESVDLVVTGEGRIDGQTIYGKVPAGIAERCKRKNVKVIAVCGGLGKDAAGVYNAGIESIMPLVNAPMLLADAMSNAASLMLDAADRMFRLIRVGLSLK